MIDGAAVGTLDIGDTMLAMANPTRTLVMTIPVRNASQPRAVKRIEFRKGPYGEVFPPLLTAHMDPNEALDRLIEDNARITGKQMRKPKYGASLAGMVNHALMYCHQLKIRSVLAGECETPVEEALYEAVTRRGEPMSMRQYGMDDLWFSTFAPVFRCLTPRATHGNLETLRWQVGLEGHGQVEVFSEADPAQALARAQRFYFEWSNADADAFNEMVKDALERVHPSMWHDYWFAQLMATEDGELWEFGAGFGIIRRGSHNTMEVVMPGRKMRVIETSHLRAVMILDALAGRANVSPRYPSPAEFRDWLNDHLAPDAAGTQWSDLDEFGLPARTTLDDKKVGLVRRKDDIALFTIEGGQYKARLAMSALDGPMPTLLKDKRTGGRDLVLRWALWRAGQIVSKAGRASGAN